ncbi:SusC/RagA family TonB-linked outer membrane protein [Pedobacter sp. CFBP9032]|uniref:SusC/RagA family TonB-linked outer membrane protein n=1 Tax=Pedobacter sp. CFBP9032 TaxID=3096539 RepID=UPI002A69D89D|nr:SusC/RagA family TonB-linked outer membrane protein [Pedobacter sp. CFBP9032]MDY0906807.1 SusC/RagA family TonB-linked outer membrane protein [Pedobacter sp. CFBP9032]
MLTKLKTALLAVTMLCFIQLHAQTVLVNGKITDASGAALPGITVKVKGTSQGVSTDSQGNFAIKTTNPSVLVISGIGFEMREFTYAGQNPIIISLKDDQQNLSEVVVTALGVKREKRNLTYSSQEVKGEQLTQTKEPNLVNALAGKVSGVQITSSSGTPGSSSRIVIRGANSLYGNNEALMVIDGIPVNNDETGNLNSGPGTNRIADLDPNIVESINVLKGGAATALYGSDGAKGVIIITTKAGAQNKKPSLSFSSSLSLETPLLPEIQNKYSLGSNGRYFDGVTEKTSTSWGARMDTLKINGQPAQVYDQSDLFFKTGKTYTNTIGLNGGGTYSSYFLSYTNLAQEGTVPTTSFDRNTVFGKFSTQILKNLDMTFSLNYANTKNNRLPEGYALESPVWTIFSAPVSYNLEPATNPDGSQRLFRFSRNNPYWVLDNISNTSVVNRFLPTFNANYKPLSWLTITERFGADVYTELGKYHESLLSVSNPNGRIVNNSSNFRQYNNDLIISANKNYGDFNIDAILGNNIISTYYQSSYANGVGITVPGFDNIASTSTINFSERSYLTRKIGFYLQSNIDYKKFLILSLTGRYDGTSVLAKDNSFYPYGSAATSFIFSNFFSKEVSDIMSFGKLRLSYSTVGNASIGPYSLLTPYESQTVRNIAFPYQGQSGFLISGTLSDPNLKNERINEFEVGLETGFFKNRLSLEVTYFDKKTKNGIIPNVALAPSTGFNSTSVNTAGMQNKGIEVLLTARPIKTEDFSWDLTLNYSRIRNKVTSIYNNLNQVGNGFTFILVNQPYGVIYGTRYARNSDGKILTGDDGLPFAADEQGIIGDINPHWMGGIINNFRYKQFTLSFSFDMKKGGDIQNNVDGYGYFYGTPKVTENREPRIVDGINANTGLPNAVSVSGQAYYQRINSVLESVIQDGTYVKLRNVSFGYNFKPAWLQKTPFKTLGLQVTGRNLWIYAPHFTGGDPEVSSFGSSNGSQGIYSFSTPTSRSVDFALKLTL